MENTDRKKWLAYGLLTLLAWLPIPLGSKHLWAISIAEIWCFLLAIVSIIHYVKNQQPLPVAFKTARIVIFLLALNLCYLLLQITPLPIQFLQTISPHTAAIHLLANPGQSYATISLDIHATWLDLIEASYLFTFFLLALYLVDNKKRLKWVVYVVLISALFQAVYGALMILTGAEYSFFITKAAIHSHIGSATGTFTNRDHLAGYLEMALALGIGYMLTLLANSSPTNLSWRAQLRSISELLLGPKARLRLLLILLCLGLILTHSRGGNIGFFASLGIAGVLFMIFSRSKPRATVIFLTSIIILDVLLIGSWVGISKVMHRLETTSIQTEQRDDTYLATLPMIQDFALTGTGSGTFFETFPAYKTSHLGGYWNHTHNDYLEILADQGTIGFTLLASTVLFSLMVSIQTLRERRSSLMLGMAFASMMGIIAILIHSAVDFNLQILANSSLFMLLLAIAMICRRLPKSSRQRKSSRSKEASLAG